MANHAPHRDRRTGVRHPDLCTCEYDPKNRTDLRVRDAGTRPTAASGRIPRIAYTNVDVATIQPMPGSHPAASRYDKGVGEALGVSAFGIYQIELPAGAETVAHDHVDDGAEDVYAILQGTGSVVVDGEAVPVAPGQFIAVSTQSTRQVRAGQDGLTFIAVCAATPTPSER